MQIKVQCGPIEMVEMPQLRDFGGEDDARNRSDRPELPE
jgi:hypothetical protein